MLDIKKRRFMDHPTVGEMKELLNRLPDNARFTVCGDGYVWIHIEDDDSIFNVDNDDLFDEYEEDE